MERKADNLSRPIVGGGNQNHTSSSSSSSSSSRSISPRDFISEINAVFSRHRPLGAKHKVSRASRVLVNKPENPQSSGNLQNIPHETGIQREADRLLGVCVGQNKDSSLENRSNSSDESILAPPSITETVTSIQDNKMCMYEHQQAVDQSKMPKEASSSTESLPKEQKLSTDILDVTLGRREGQFDNLVQLGNNYSDQRDLQTLDMHASIESNMLENRDNFHHDRKPSCPTSMSVVTDPPLQCTYVASSQVLSNSLASKPYHAIEKVTSSQLPSSHDSASNVNIGVLKTIKTEKSSHKKKYDPHVFFKVNGKLYQKLGKIGSGGSSEVYKVVTSDCTMYALKKIKLKGRDYPMAYGFCQEILYLKKLKGRSNIIQLIDYEVTDKKLLQEVMNGCMTVKDGKIMDDHHIYMVLEYGEIDLAHMLSQKFVEVGNSRYNTDENWLRFYWQQMLEAVNTIHEERIVHSDLKPANFLLVKGSLKLIDFGIAKAILNDTTNIQREAQVGTLNYMSPEAFMWNEHDLTGGTIKCGRPSDIWSLGCILYQMVYGKTPFADHKTFWAKFKVITDKNHEIAYHKIANPLLIDLMKRCLAWDRNQRWRIPQLLNHPFLLPPPVPNFLLDDPERKHLFEKISFYRDHPDVSRLCSELREVVSKLEREKETLL